ncbi:MAG: ABC transporter permease [Gammaproteobacteria bacterium]|nr:ABC transporter permease [Gammaproteobacteria bacterium]
MSFVSFLSKDLIPDIRSALSYLSHHGLRTFLTLLGMIFGVGAVIAMLAVSEGGQREALAMIETMGANNLIIHDESPTDDTLIDVRQHTAGLSVADAKAIADSMPFVESWAAIRELPLWDDLFSPEGSSSAEVWAVSPEYFSLSGLDVDLGELFSIEDDQQYAQKAVLGDAVARQLFPRGDAIGQRFKVNSLWVEVIGILADRQLSGEDFQGEQVGGESGRAYIPLSTGLTRMPRDSMDAELSQLKLKIKSGQNLFASHDAIKLFLDRRHGNQEDFRIVVPARLLAQQNQTQQIFTVVMCVVAGISLVVGGIGIMNIMLACVLERRSEIGLLRAVGARRSDVVRQFLIETTVIALLGAFLGIIAGFVIAYGVNLFSHWAIAFSLLSILGAAIVCATIAVGFGVYPAMAASKLDPVAALQSE